MDLTGWQVVRVYLVIRALQGTQDCLATTEEKEKRCIEKTVFWWSKGTYFAALRRVNKGHEDTWEQVADRDHKDSLELGDHQATKE